MGTQFKARPLSNKKICDFAKQFKKILGIKNDVPIDILFILEIAMPLLDSDFNFSIRQKEDMAVDAHAYIDHDTKEIVILDEIYIRAVKGHGRDRFTIAHEIAHYLLHDKNVLTRAFENEKIKTFEDPEWQANAFAGELLCPAEVAKNMSIDEIVKKYGISVSAARVQKSKGEKLK